MSARRPPAGFRFVLTTFGIFTALCAPPLVAAPPAPTLDPAGGALTAPVKVTIRCASPEASIHISMDGKEPTPRDTEVDSGSSVVVDEPLTFKAKAWLPDGSASATTTVNFPLKPVDGNGASFVEQSVPALMVVGQRYSVAVTYRNVGKIPWIPATHTLAPNRAADGLRWGIGPVAVREPVGTWKMATLQFAVTAPSAPGTYNLRLRMQTGAQPFGEPTPTARVVVLSPAEYQHETGGAAGAVGSATSDATRGAGEASVRKLAPLTESAAAALSAAKSRMEKSDGGELDRLVRELQFSARSFKYLRTIGFAKPEAEYERWIAENPALFRSVRIVRRDENGQRVIPGWPGIALQGKR